MLTPATWQTTCFADQDDLTASEFRIEGLEFEVRGFTELRFQKMKNGRPDSTCNNETQQLIVVSSWVTQVVVGYPQHRGSLPIRTFQRLFRNALAASRQFLLAFLQLSGSQGRREGRAPDTIVSQGIS